MAFSLLHQGGVRRSPSLWVVISQRPLTMFGRVSVVWLLEVLSCSAALESAADPEFHYHDFGFLELGWTINLGGLGQETLA
ncbi:hypothetical protein EDD85DRAFT_953194 [Armillaria nabsnona]|nr:hypothetical protein EDD85DRAFT_953194 [Armillaria nabsnona]